MITVMEILTTMIGRAQRAYDRSRDMELPKDQRTFHRGRYEAYLQTIALINGKEVKDIRPLVLGVERMKIENREERKRAKAVGGSENIYQPRHSF